MHKKRKKIIVTGGIVTSMLLYGAHTSFAQNVRTSSSSNGYVMEYNEPETFKEHIELLITNGSIPETKVPLYKNILKKIEDANSSS